MEKYAIVDKRGQVRGEPLPGKRPAQEEDAVQIERNAVQSSMHKRHACTEHEMETRPPDETSAPDGKPSGKEENKRRQEGPAARVEQFLWKYPGPESRLSLIEGNDIVLAGHVRPKDRPGADKGLPSKKCRGEGVILHATLPVMRLFIVRI